MQHYDDVMMRAKASEITSRTIVYSTVYSGTDERKHQSSTSLAFVRGIHRWPVVPPHKGPVTRKMFPFDDVIMGFYHSLGGGAVTFTLTMYACTSCVTLPWIRLLRHLAFLDYIFFYIKFNIKFQFYNHNRDQHFNETILNDKKHIDVFNYHWYRH